jgi:ATP-dependent Clp protease ATP-binding subunit ClpA
VGYDVGGELTNAIREKPFSVVLFDEIEKAHPRILDKFLQILDDGVLTSGRGDRVYFSEAFIIFTSNLGIYRIDSDGNRVQQFTPDDIFETIADKVRHEIDQHFKLALGRPEILNRIGENIIVFDFIRPQIALEIFNQMIDSTIADLGSVQGINVSVPSEARKALQKLCLSDLSNGGRGIRNKLEAHFVNPLARALFDAGAKSGSELVVGNIEAGTVTTIKLGTLVGEATR